MKTTESIFITDKIVWHKSALKNYLGLTDQEIRRKLKNLWYTRSEQNAVISFLHKWGKHNENALAVSKKSCES